MKAEDHPKPLFLPTVKGKGYTKCEMDLLLEMDAEINAKFRQTIKELEEWARSGPVKQPARFVGKKKVTGVK